MISPRIRQMQSTESPSTKKTERTAEATPLVPKESFDGGGKRLGLWGWFASHRKPEILPGMSLPARPGLLVLTTVLLAGFCVILAICGHGRRTDSSGIDLLEGTSSSNLNITSAATSAT